MTGQRTPHEGVVEEGSVGQRPRPRGTRFSRVAPILGVPGGRLLVALSAATVLLALGFVVVLVHTVVRAASAGPPPEPAVEARFHWREPPEIRLVKERPSDFGELSRAVAEPARAPRAGRIGVRRWSDASRRAEAPDVAGTVVRWREEAKLRRVAGILLLDDDYEGAMEILLQIKGEDSRAFALDRAAHAKILGGLRPALLREREALKAFLRAQPLAPLGGPGGAAGRRTVPDMRRFLALPPEDFHLPQCAAALPEGVALCFMRNVHVRLARATGGSDTLVALVLSLGFRQGSDAARVYWADFPSEYTPYPEALPGGI